MIALDLYCSAGGASMGLHQAGFEVVGIDHVAQPRYPFEFQRHDAIVYLEALLFAKRNLRQDPDVSLVWASPPCQAFTAYKRRGTGRQLGIAGFARDGHVKPSANLIPQTRELLRQLGIPYIIENVPGAPLLDPVTLCGSMFGLDVKRHRIFETSFPVRQPACDHKIWTPRFPCAGNRTNLRSTVEIGVWRIPLEVQRVAIGIDWMDLDELSQAIPPAYSTYLASEFLRHREAA